MSHDAETELWKLWFDLDQMRRATHYYSDLKPTAENYKDQWDYFAQQSDSLIKTFNRLCVHLGITDIELAAPDAPDVGLPDMGVGDDEIPF